MKKRPMFILTLLLLAVLAFGGPLFSAPQVVKADQPGDADATLVIDHRACGECMRAAAETEQRCHKLDDPNEQQACRNFVQNTREKCLFTFCGPR